MGTRSNASKLHLAVYSVLCDVFRHTPILQEVLIPIDPGKNAYLDFYLPQLKVAIEAHGEQHYKFSNKFFASRREFLNQKKRDIEKREWCRLNGITYVELRYDQTEQEWRECLAQLIA